MESFQVYLLGQAISFALVKQGLEPLHATAVEVQGKAVVFLGQGGAGKSTLAAYFISRGHKVLTDDLLVLRKKSQGLVGYPGPPRIKLFPSLAKKLFGREFPGTRMNPFTRKMILPLASSQVLEAPTPIRAIYTIGQQASGSSRAISIENLSARNAFFELVKNTFNRRSLYAERLERNFLESSLWANRAFVRKLSYPRKLSCLTTVYDAILGDVQSVRKRKQ